MESALRSMASSAPERIVRLSTRARPETSIERTGLFRSAKVVAADRREAPSIAVTPASSS